MMRICYLILIVCCFFLVSCDSGNKPAKNMKSGVAGDIDKAAELYNAGKYVECERELSAILGKNPNHVYALYYMGFVAFQRSDFINARKFLIGALEQNPSTEFCESIQQLFMLETSKILGSGKGIWQTPVLLNSKRAVALAIMEDSDGDGRISLLDNSFLVHVQLESRKATVLVDGKYPKGAPAPSPDGNKIVYASARADTSGDGYINHLDNSGIYIYDIEQRKEVELMNSKFHNSDPMFSLDGKSIFFVSVRLDSNGDNRLTFDDNFAIFRFDLATQEVRKVLAVAGDCRRPFPMSDGKSILFWGINEDSNQDGQVTNGDYGGLYKYNLENPKIEPILSWKNAISFFDYWLQGDKLVISMHPDPGDTMTRDEAYEKDPSQYGYGLYMYDVVTNVRKKIIEPVLQYLKQPSMASDGHTIAFQRSNIEHSAFVCYYYDMDEPYLSAGELIRILKSSWETDALNNSEK